MAQMTDDTGGELMVGQVEPAYKKDYCTFEDWEALDESLYAELHDGTLIVMEAPVEKHQKVSGELFYQICGFLKGKPCVVFAAPYAVRLNEEEDSVFLPDIVVICDKFKRKSGKRCDGAPDLVIEILSPSTRRIDMLYKFSKYRDAGVKEYWIVDPDAEILQVNILHDGSYITSMHDKDAKVPVSALPGGCVIDLAEVFAQ